MVHYILRQRQNRCKDGFERTQSRITIEKVQHIHDVFIFDKGCVYFSLLLQLNVQSIEYKAQRGRLDFLALHLRVPALPHCLCVCCCVVVGCGLWENE